MILYAYSLKDRKVNAFTAPQFHIENPVDYAETMRRAIVGNPSDPKAIPLRDMDLYLVGCFDDNTGSFAPQNEFLADLRDYFPRVDAIHHEKETMMKEEKENSRGEKDTI